ncbi:hypothetical protein BSL78_06790 [Apostichopus japonicus]|uniref:C2H2-type domain-containing protein n=1 Tax=Stichopus japonicus TaxID=307972 RepID=A0A2G8L7R4_STIJA|nr:hypothetical protein BSL78_06790 [Apostichopus japonicus]
MERKDETEWSDVELERCIEYRCRICRQRQSSAADLKSHFQKEHGRKRFYCETCSYQSDRKTDVQRHSDAKHRKLEAKAKGKKDHRNDGNKDYDKEPPKVKGDIVYAPALETCWVTTVLLIKNPTPQAAKGIPTPESPVHRHKSPSKTSVIPTLTPERPGPDPRLFRGETSDPGMRVSEWRRKVRCSHADNAGGMEVRRFETGLDNNTTRRQSTQMGRCSEQPRRL